MEWLCRHLELDFNELICKPSQAEWHSVDLVGRLFDELRANKFKPKFTKKNRQQGGQRQFIS